MCFCGCVCRYKNVCLCVILLQCVQNVKICYHLSKCIFFSRTTTKKANKEKPQGINLIMPMAHKNEFAETTDGLNSTYSQGLDSEEEEVFPF